MRATRAMGNGASIEDVLRRGAGVRLGARECAADALVADALAHAAADGAADADAAARALLGKACAALNI